MEYPDVSWTRRVVARFSFLPARCLTAEIEDVLLRPKFAQRLELAGTTAHELILGYAAWSTVMEPAVIAPVVLADPDDDAVIACAVAAHAQVVVSGDSHLLDLQHYQQIVILRAAELLARITL